LPTQDPFHTGHRARLRERFRIGGAEAVAPYELLEMILFGAYPRGDVKPLAKQLIKEFKTFSAVLNAPDSELLRIKGIGPAAISALRTVAAAAQLMLREHIQAGPLQTTLSHVLDYCKISMEHLQNEQLRLLFLDKKNRLITDEVQQTGTIDHTPVYTREVIKRALELGASSLIIVHNHPSGDPTPSQADVLVTREIQSAAEKLGMHVHDHIVIGKGAHISFREKGLL
jgi:DNA repair protein RadC